MVELKFFCCFDREVKKKEVFPFCIVKWRFGRNFSVLFSSAHVARHVPKKKDPKMAGFTMCQ